MAAIVYDLFTDTDATALASHTPNIDVVAGGWTVAAGAMTISSNKATFSAGTHHAWIESSDSDCIIRCKVTPQHTDGSNYANVGLEIRAIDVNNRFWVVLDMATDQFRLYKIDTGSSSLEDFVASMSFNSGQEYDLLVTCEGTSITATLDGDNEISYTGSFNQTEVLFGLFGYSIGSPPGSPSFDDFWVAEIPAWETPIYDRTITDINTKTSKGYFNIADFDRIDGNTKVINELILLYFETTVAETLLLPRTIDRFEDVADINDLVENIENARAALNLPASFSLVTLLYNYIAGPGGTAPDYADVNAWESNQSIIYDLLDRISSYRIYCGVAACGQSHLWQHRFRPQV